MCILEWYNGAFSVNYGHSKLVNEEETIHTYKKEIDSGGVGTRKSFGCRKKINKAYFIAAIMSILFNITLD